MGIFHGWALWPDSVKLLKASSENDNYFQPKGLKLAFTFNIRLKNLKELLAIEWLSRDWHDIN